MRSDGRWVVRPLSDIADVVGGGTPSTEDSDNFGSEIAWLTPRDLSGHQSRWIARGQRGITEQGLTRSSARILPPKAVLVSSRAPIGYVVLAANDLATSQGFRSLVVKDGNVPEFFYYVMRRMKPTLEAAASGTTFREISGSAMKKIAVPVPPSRDQAAIAALLGALDDKLDSNRRLISLLDAFVSLEFGQRFRDSSRVTNDWQLGTLGDLGTVRGGGTPRTDVPEYWDDGGIVWLTPTDMTSLHAPVVSSSVRRISRLGLEESGARLLPAGTVLYTSRATVGLVAIARTAVATNQGFVAVEPKNGYSSEFVMMVLRAEREAIVARATGSIFPEVSKATFMKVPVLLPPQGVLGAFDELAGPIFRWIGALDEESRLLASLRDDLALVLTTGSLRIS